MNQFKKVFLTPFDELEPELKSLKLAANSQKCIRISGKHNDLTQVGRDGFHHSFFEMLGHWSFHGHISAFEACKHAWTLLTEVFNLDPRRLFITFLKEQQTGQAEAWAIWRDVGVDSTKLASTTSLAENFWEMGPTGPCGPCTEIHYSPADPPSLANSRELWNLVFMKYNRKVDGTLESLVKPHIDTGMGMERLTAILQGNPWSNYSTDLFLPLMKRIQDRYSYLPPYRDLYGVKDGDQMDQQYRIIADHMRAVTVALSDGVVPASKDAGNCVRKLLRRAAYSAQKLGAKPVEILPSLCENVVDSLGIAYPELAGELPRVKEVVEAESQNAKRAIGRGRRVFKSLLQKKDDNILTENDVHVLREVYGMPLDLIGVIAEDNNLNCDCLLEA